MGSVGSLTGVQSDYVERALQSGDGQFISYDPATPIASTDPRTVVSNAYQIYSAQLSILPTYLLFIRNHNFGGLCHSPDNFGNDLVILKKITINIMPRKTLEVCI